MNRKVFVSKLLALGGLAAIPKQSIKGYTKIYLLQCFVAGFRYYKGPELVKSMKKGDILELVREPKNKYDQCAISLHYNKQKIGFIPAEENEMLSRLIDAGVIELMAEITHLEPNAATWESVRTAVYVLKGTNSPIPDHAGYLTELDAPKYRSLKIEKRDIRYSHEPQYA